eukprot:GHRR01021207.1.p1 GENE.GHRR01021207.1~~GHRR01021207.1.p1  ORF type:complete len:250 (+),score=70.72 GHRR01021207.1:159-908(+)
MQGSGLLQKASATGHRPFTVGRSQQYSWSSGSMRHRNPYSSSNNGQQSQSSHADRLAPFCANPLSGAAAAAAVSESKQEQQQLHGKDVVMQFYDAYNRRDLATIESLLADEVSYHDLVYEEPHEGKKGVLGWLKKVRKYAPDDLKFVIEDITDGDPLKVGVKWHVQCGHGIDFPFSRGCSFITLNEQGKMLTVRDVVEPAFKPGDQTLMLLGGLTPLIRKLGPKANPAYLKQLPIASAAVWALYIGKER